VPRRAKRSGRSLAYVNLRGQQLAVLSVPLLPELPAALTPAEREVVALIFAGSSNAAIAKARGVAVRTVANQVASILRKLEVGSRSALLAALSGKGRGR
jgi:DNA-binding CsgD family transcriptional regulator